VWTRKTTTVIDPYDASHRPARVGATSIARARPTSRAQPATAIQAGVRSVWLVTTASRIAHTTGPSAASVATPTHRGDTRARTRGAWSVTTLPSRKHPR